jgi:hypothetical protein
MGRTTARTEFLRPTGGASKLTFLFYGDPLLIKAVKRAEVLASLDDL